LRPEDLPAGDEAHFVAVERRPKGDPNNGLGAGMPDTRRPSPPFVQRTIDMLRIYEPDRQVPVNI
jgi:hypothetical protein